MQEAAENLSRDGKAGPMRWTALLAAAALLIAALAQTAHLLSFRGRFFSKDKVTAYMDRFACLKGSLPEGVDTLGYLPDYSDGGYFKLAQYTLAPLVLRRSYAEKYLLVNFHDTARPLPPELTPVADCGNGVRLATWKR